MCEFTKGVSLDVLYLNINDFFEVIPHLQSIRVPFQNIFQAHSVSTETAIFLSRLGKNSCSVGRAVASDTRGPWFESSHWENVISFLSKEIKIYNFCIIKNYRNCVFILFSCFIRKCS